MAVLAFKVEADYEKVKRLREEINKLKAEISGTNGNLNPQKFDELNGKLQQVTNEFKNLTESASRAGTEIVNQGDNVSTVVDSLAKKAAALFAADKIKDFVNQVIQVRGQFQQLEMSFKTMLQSGDKADALMQQLIQTAATTPFDLDGVANGAKQLLAYGIAADEVNDTLIRCGDVAAGLSIPLGDLVYLYGTTVTQGRMFTQDLRQFQGRGIPIAEELSKVLGVTTSKLGELVTAGKVTSDVFIKAFNNMTAEGSKFGGLMDEQSKTITGQIANIEDAIDMMFNDIGKKSEGVINVALSGVGTLVENYEEVGRQIGALVTAYGAYKAALIVITAVQKANVLIMRQAVLEQNLAAAAGITLGNAEAIAAARTKLLALAQQGLVKAVKSVTAALATNPYVLAAMAVAALAVTVYELATAESSAERHANAMNAAIDDQRKAIEQFHQQNQQLIDTATDETKSIYERETAFQQLALVIPSVTEKYKDLKTFTDAMKGDGGKPITNGILDDADLAKMESDKARWEQIIKDMEVLKKHEYTIGFGWDTVQADAVQSWGMTEEEAKGFVNRMKSLYKELGDSIDHSYVKTEAEDLVTAFDEISGKADGFAKAYEDAADRMQAAKLAEEQQKEQQEFEKTYNSIDKTKNAINLYNEQIEQLKKQTKGSAFTVIADIITKEKPKYWYQALHDRMGEITNANPLSVFAEIKLKNAESFRDRLQKWLGQQQGDNYETNYKKAETDYKAADKKVRDIEKNKKNYSTEQYKAAVAERDEKKKAFQDLGGNTSTSNKRTNGNASTETAAERQKRIQDASDREKELVAKNAQELKRTEQDLAFETEQARIDTLADGYEKEKAQRNLNHQKILEELEREKQDTVQKVKDAAEAEWDAKENVKKQKDKKYVTKSFDWDTNATDEQKAQAASVSSAYDNRIGIQKNINTKEDVDANSKVLEQYQSYFQRRLKIEEKYENDRKALIAADATQDQINELDYRQGQETDKLDEEIAMRSTDFQAWCEAIADMGIEQLQKMLEDAEDTLEEMGSNGGASGDDIAKVRAEIAKLKKSISQQQSKENINDSKNSPKNKTIKKWQKLSNAMGEAATELVKIGDELGGTVGKIISTTGQFAQSVSSMITNITLLATGSVEGIKVTSEAGANAIKAVENASVILAIIGAALQIVTKLMSMFGANYDKYNAEKEAVENLAEVWDTLVRLKQEYISTSYGDDAVEAAKDALSYVKQASDAYRQLGKDRLNSGASAGSHSIGIRIKKSLQENQKLMQSFIQGANAAGVSTDWLMYNRMENLFNLSVDQLKALREKGAYFWASLDADTKDQLEKIIEYGDTAEDTIDSLTEQLTGISFDSMFDDFLDNLMDMEYSAKDFANDMNETMTKALISSTIGEKYKKQLQAWVGEFSKVMQLEDKQRQAEGIASLKKQYAEISRNAMEEARELQEAMGYDQTSQQDGDTGGFEAMSQDTAEELSGRFTALQVVAQNTMASISQINGSIMGTLAIIRDSYNIHNDARTILADSLLELKVISDNTAPTKKMLPILERIEDKLKLL